MKQRRSWSVATDLILDCLYMPHKKDDAPRYFLKAVLYSFLHCYNGYIQLRFALLLLASHEATGAQLRHNEI